jgi:malonyl-CoA O-methyltransferase
VAWLVADAETLGLGSFDLIISNATFQWLTRPGETLQALSHSLLPQGRLAYSTLGPGTFRELAASWRQAADTLNSPDSPPIAAEGFLTQEHWRDLLDTAGFSQVHLERRLLEVPFPSVGHFLKALQATGATNPQPRPFSPRLLRELIACYDARFRRNGTIPVTYEIIWVIAGKSVVSDQGPGVDCQ